MRLPTRFASRRDGTEVILDASLGTRTSGRFGRAVANAIFGEQVHRFFSQIPLHRQKQDHHGEGIDVTSHSLIGNSKLYETF